MMTLHFTIDIRAATEKIWKSLWEDTNYRDWTSAFTEGSYAITDHWKQGSKVHFLAPGGGGMYSLIERHIPNELMSFKHIGTIEDGKEQPLDDEARKWSGAREIYRLTDRGESAILNVDVDTEAGFTEYMNKTFPKALARVKEIAEND